MKRAPVLKGLSIDISKRGKDKKLFRIGFGLTTKCQLSCIYCLAADYSVHETDLSPGEYKTILHEASALGVKTVAFVGQGEPLCYQYINQLLQIAANLKMSPIVFTNGQKLDDKMCDLLWETGTSVILKLNSLNSCVHDYLVGKKGAHAKAMHSLSILIDKGFSRLNPLQLGIQTVIIPQNIKGIEKLWSFCRANNLFPYFETLRRCGRGGRDPSFIVSYTELHDLYQRLLSIDKNELGYSWNAHPPYVAMNCQQHFYSCFVRADGSITPCSGVNLVVGSIRQQSLSKILQQQLFLKLRNMPDSLESSCRLCRYNTECYGCRANALAYSGNLFGPDPDCWVNQ